MRVRPNASPLARMGILMGYRSAQNRADLLGISRSHLLHVERGSVVPSGDLVARMAQAYEKEPEAVEQAFRDHRVALARKVIAGDKERGVL